MMHRQVDLDAIKVNAQVWYAKFRRDFDKTWNEGLEEPQQAQQPATMEQQPMQQELMGGAAEMQNPLPPTGGLGNA